MTWRKRRGFTKKRFELEKRPDLASIERLGGMGPRGDVDRSQCFAGEVFG